MALAKHWAGKAQINLQEKMVLMGIIVLPISSSTHTNSSQGTARNSTSSNGETLCQPGRGRVMKQIKIKFPHQGEKLQELFLEWFKQDDIACDFLVYIEKHGFLADVHGDGNTVTITV